MKVDTKEFELPDTLFVRDIDTQVFQTIVLECLAKVEGIHLLEGGLVSQLLSFEEKEQVKGIHIEQDQKNHSVNIKIEIMIAYGIPIPQKAEEIQNLISMEITKMTGLHVGLVHVVFKNIYVPKEKRKHVEQMISSEEEYNEDNF